MNACLFCKIVDHTVPVATIYEDDNVVAFLDVHPRAPGHTLVIPKIHVQCLRDLTDELIEPLFMIVKKIAGTLENVFSANGMTIGINQGEASGQTVPHLHIHLMPRFTGDGGGSIHSVVNNPSGDAIDVIRERIGKELQNSK